MAFLQISLDVDSIDSIEYTSFNVEFGLFKFKVFPFGVVNGPAEFSHLMRAPFLDQLHIYICLMVVKISFLLLGW